ncbi:MAG TPA: hypothetical protein VK421_15080 [Pyrinomonadaceae bacterium]|nr:hypothetical protein [Pyrinomonadaceae bacterium]
MKSVASLKLAVFICLAALGQPAGAPAQPGAPRARKFDEFTVGIGSRRLRRAGNYEEQSKELKRRLARYAAELRRTGARPYAITYGPRVVEWEIYNRSIAGMRAGALWEVTSLGVDWRQINWVNGGFREEAATELWIVPPGAQPPCPTPSVRPEDVAYCPFVRVGGVPYVPRPSGTIRFNAIVRFNDEKIRPAFAWQVSRGRIASGQGTDAIEVELPADAVGDVVARVEVGGFSLECPAEFTADFAPTAVGLSHFLFDEFGNIHSGDTKARLDNLAHTLGEDPTLLVHLVTYGGRTGPRGQSARRAQWLRDYLVNTRGVDSSRVFTVDGGYRDELSGELWLSVGSDPPPVRPTVDESFTKPLQPRPSRAGRRFSHAQPKAQGRAACDLPPSRRIDEYSATGEEEKARLDKFVAVLKGEPEDVKGFVVAYAGRAAPPGEALRRADAAKQLLIDKGPSYNSYNSRLNTIDCGRREQTAVELWLTPVGAAPPVCAPTIKTIAPATKAAVSGGRGARR